MHSSTRTIQHVLLAFSGLLLTLLVTISYTFFKARTVQVEQDAYMSLVLHELELIDSLQDNENVVHKTLLLHLTSSDDADMEKYEREINVTQVNSRQILRQLRKMISDENRLTYLHAFEQEAIAHDTLISHLLELSRSGDSQEAFAYNTQVITPEYQQHQSFLKRLSDSIRHAARKSGHEASLSIAAFVENHKILLFITVVVGMIAIWLVRNVIYRLRLDNDLLNAEIEERQELQKALLESQTQYKLLFDHNPLPMMVYDQQSFHLMDVNEAALLEYGYTRSEFLQLGIFDIHPENDVPLFKYKLDKQDKSLPRSSRSRHMRKDGSLFETEVRSHALPDAGDKQPRLVVAVNVDERQQIIDKLQKSEKQLREISSSIPGAVFQFRMDSKTSHRFTFVSEGIRDLFQVSPAEVYADPLALYRHIDQRDVRRLQYALLTSYRQLSPLVAIFRIRQPHTDRYKWVQAHGLPTLRRTGQVIWNGTMIDITDQKYAQEQLVASEANLRALLNSSPQAVYLLDEDMNIMMFNSVARNDVLRSLLQELRVGQQLLHYISPDMAGGLKEQHARALQGETIIYEIGHGDFWHEIALRPVTGPGNRVLAVALNILDISERKMTLETLKRHEEQLARAQQLAQLGNWELDVVWNTVTWSDSVYNIYGLDKATFSPTFQGVLQFIPEHDREVLLQKYEVAARENTILTMEHRVMRPDGSTRIVYEIGEPEYDEAGKLVRFHGSVQDITERKNTEQEALRTKNMLQSTLENIPEIIFSADSDLNLVYISPQCRELTGYTEDEFLANPELWQRIIQASDRLYLQEQVLPGLQSGERQHCEIRISTKEKQIKWLMLRISPKVDTNGQVYRFDGSASDMTKYKEAEAKRNELTDQLLRQNQNLQQFAYIVSHNLRAPIANILGLTTVYDKHKPDSPMNPRVIDNLFKSARLLDTTIRDLNDLLTIRSELSTVRERVEFAEILEEVKDSLPDELYDKSAVIISDFKEAPSVVAVRSYVQSIMLNLVTNALKYKSPDRNLQLQLKSVTIPNYICLSVSDNGLGIDLSREKEKVFGLYKRFHSHKEGRGLGLHLVKTQAELLGGKVEVDSQVDVGTTFNIYFRYNV